MFTVYDSKAEAYLQPWGNKTKGQAIRMFTDTVRDEKSNFNKHPEDYTLFEIGEYDESTAELLAHEAKISLGSAIEMLQDNNV